MRRIVTPLVLLLILLAPVLVSPSLRAGMGDTFEGTKEYILNESFPKESVRATAIGLVLSSVVIAFLGTVVWLNTEASSGSQLEGWRRVVFILTSLLLFLATFGGWLWGLTEIARYDWTNASPDEISGALIFMVILIVVALIWTSLARPAFRAVRILIGR